MKAARIASILLFLGLAAIPGAAQKGTWTRIGPDGGHVQEIVAAPSNPQIVYAGLGLGGVFRSADQGRTWTFAGAGLVSLSVRDLEVDPRNPDRVYAATGQGLLGSADGGRTWRRLGRAELTAPFGPSVLEVEIHPRQPAVLLAALDRGRLFRSADRGRTWSSSPDWPESVVSLAASRVRSGVFWASVEGGVLYRSTDSGLTWIPLPGSGLPEGLVARDLAADPHVADTLYALVDGQPGVFKSTDGGATWTSSQEGLDALVRNLEVDASRPSTVYALTQDRIFRSADGGTTWTPLAGAGLRGAPLTVTPLASGLLAGTDFGLFQSRDQGATWRPSQAGLTASRISSLALDGQEPLRLYAVDLFQGLFKTREGARSWQFLGRPVTVDSFPGTTGPVAVHPDTPDTVYVGVPLHMAKSENGGRRWTAHLIDSCFQPTWIELDPHDPATLYTSGSQAGNCADPLDCILFRSRDAGETWTCIGDALPGPFGGPLLEIDPRTSALYVVVATDVWTSTDQGETWTLFAPGLAPSSLAGSPARAGLFWAGGSRTVRTSRDGGKTWSFSFAGLPPRSSIQHLAPHPTNPAIVYAGTYAHGVFRSTDGGLTWARLGNWPAGLRLWGGIMLDPRDPRVVYAATDGAGVLRYEP